MLALVATVQTAFALPPQCVIHSAVLGLPLIGPSSCRLCIVFVSYSQYYVSCVSSPVTELILCM